MPNREYAILDLATLVGGTLRGDGSANISGVADINEAQPHEATWVSRCRFEAAAKTTNAGVVLVPAGFGDSPVPVIFCEDIQRSVAALLAAFARPIARPPSGIHPSAVIDSTAILGESCSVGPCAVIDANVRIGARAIIHAGAFIGRDSVLG